MHRSRAVNMMLQIFFLLTALAAAAPRPSVNSEDLTLSLDKRQSSSYWMETIQRKGEAAFNNDTSYKVFRNVKNYGAVGDGTTDDTAAINKAISDGNRCGTGNCDSSTITPAIIYFPAGTYKISSSIVMYYYTQMIGDGTNLPRIQGSADFNFTNNLALLDADPYIPNGNGDGWYTNQNNFFRQIRNLVIDMTLMPETAPDGSEVNGVHWQVAQACSMQNVVFDMKAATSTSKQRGIMMENGSGMFMSDIVFNGGNVGAYLGSQQFTTRNFTFNGCNTAVEVIWDWLWTFKSLNVQNCGVGLNISTTNSVNETLGSAILMDSTIQATTAAIVTSYGPETQPEAGSTFLIQNVDFAGSQVAVLDSKTQKTVLAGNVKIAAWGQGNAYIPSNAIALSKRAAHNTEDAQNITTSCNDMSTIYQTVTVSPIPASSTTAGTVNSLTVTTSNGAGTTSSLSTASTSTISTPYPANSTNSNATAAATATQCSSSAVIPTQSKVLQQNLNAAPIPSSLLTSTGSVFERGKPQYIDVPVASFISVKTFGAKGDGVTDDTAAVQSALSNVTTDQVLFFDHGAYLISKTVDVPANIRITGEIWPLIMITGEFFSDSSNPQPAFRVGKPGDSGNVEITDLMFETKGPAPGAIMMEWNVQEASQGSCGLWDTHFRVGGSAGTDLQQAQCDSRNSNEFRSECAGSFMMMHVTQTASAYFENTWFWVADHDLDLATRSYPRPQANETQVSIYNGRGVFIESQGPVWLWGTSVEHSVLYNYQISNAKNVFMAGIQTETAYMQSSPNALNSGFTPNAAYSDPDFADCTSDSCKKTWGLRIVDSEDIFMYGGGLYSFFDDYQQQCLDTEDCQENMVDIECSSSVYLYGLVTKATTNQVVVNGQPAVLEKDNPNLFGATVLLYQQQ